MKPRYILWLGAVSFNSSARSAAAARRDQRKASRIMGVRPDQISVQEIRGEDWSFWPREAQ